MKRSCVTQRSVGFERRVRSAMRAALRTLLAAALLLGANSGCASWRAAQLYQSGTRALDAGLPERAVRQLESAVELEPQRSEIRNHLGLAYAALGNPDAAEVSFEAALALDCENEAARRNLAGLRAGELAPMSELESSSVALPPPR